MPKPLNVLRGRENPSQIVFQNFGGPKENTENREKGAREQEGQTKKQAGKKG